jgi:hypothetical protein
MKSRNSAWAPFRESMSPTGELVAKIEFAMEVAMGAPTRGKLEILAKGKKSGSICDVEDCSPSFVWSEDGRFLASPQWDTRDMTQRLLVVDVENRRTIPIPGQFRVLELDSFENFIVQGIDSPVYMPKQLNIDVSEWIQQ